ncbi:TetR/AcrR family transcriptional regulator [Actinobacteria bacterium YIM 96077]|uniref:HTH tetR-type domain-containing protein n=1 Tax=Phytoactinopolyspora halophila TaxID=1981511 RepID=A0A329QLG4_9ACTN|nr:TetR/AcrR family transcriptional regulator [Phytoactinopolyspora halophila]AYY14819.1 TetR/AcrR family transcriptional regulator [Actinobacteria bacterium YIM 96077]RAW13093.1 hypothetical protein DPM12_13540 [Phytoactinopolyspora halophila]
MDDNARELESDMGARIRSVALELFTKQGYEKTSLRQIAERLGVSKAAVYYHYRTKVSILDDLLRPLADGEEEIIDAAHYVSVEKPEGRYQIIVRFIDLLLEHRELATYVMTDIVGASNSRMVPRLQRYDRQLIEMLSPEGVPRAEQVRALSAFGAVMAVLTLAEVPSEELRPLVLQTARDALRVPDVVS